MTLFEHCALEPGSGSSTVLGSLTGDHRERSELAKS